MKKIKQIVIEAKYIFTKWLQKILMIQNFKIQFMVIFSFLYLIVNNADSERGYRVSHYKKMSFDVVCFFTKPLMYLSNCMWITGVVIIVLPKRK